MTKVADAVLTALEAPSVTVLTEATIGRVVTELAFELAQVFPRRDKLATEIEEVSLAVWASCSRPCLGLVRAPGRASWPRSVTAPGSRTATSSPPR